MAKGVKALLGVLAVLALTGAGAAPAPAAMQSKWVDDHLCKTVGGGRFVDIPGYPGERIDRRLLPDIKRLRSRYSIFVTDGYSTSPIHAANGEHPIGLATDIVPHFSLGGSWDLIADLAHWAEPRQDHPRVPFRWVGWNGDPFHGRGDHLHLSWMHSPADFGEPARVVYTRLCPEPPDTPWDDVTIGKLAPVVPEA